MSTDTLIPDANYRATDDGRSNDDKFLSFCLGQEEYGVEILRVREIIGILDITPLPQMPDYVKGVVNLRGKIIPVVELRSKFGMPAVEYDEKTCIIVVEVADPNGLEQFQMGVVVDTVSEVLNIAKDHIERAPHFGCSLDTSYILGMGKTKEKVITLLDIDKVLTAEERIELRKSADVDAPTAQSEPQTEDAGEMAAEQVAAA